MLRIFWELGHAPERRFVGWGAVSARNLSSPCLAGRFCQNAGSIGLHLCLISVFFQWLTTSLRPLTEQGETWGPAGRNRENLEPLQGEPMGLRSSRGAFDSPRDQRRRRVAHELNRWSGATNFLHQEILRGPVRAPIKSGAVRTAAHRGGLSPVGLGFTMCASWWTVGATSTSRRICVEHIQPDLDAHTTPHGCAISQRDYKRTEEPFGWAKTIGSRARPRPRRSHGRDLRFTLTMAVLRPNPVAQVASIAHAIWSVSAPLLVSADLSLPQVVDLRAEAIKISPGS